MTFIAGIQARLGSERLPNKVLFPIGGKAIVQHVVDATDEMDVDDTVILTDENSYEIAKYTGFAAMYQGLVSERFVAEAKTWDDPDLYFVRLCGDQPFVDPYRANMLIKKAKETKADYVGYLVDGRPSALTAYGIYAEVFRADALKRAEPSDHVTNTIYMRPDLFQCEWIVDDEIQYSFSLTVDTILDYYRIKHWYEYWGGFPAMPGGDPFKNDRRYDWL
jgi:spore coat polysaccharide biosynthesis protein SpsF